MDGDFKLQLMFVATPTNTQTSHDTSNIYSLWPLAWVCLYHISNDSLILLLVAMASKTQLGEPLKCFRERVLISNVAFVIGSEFREVSNPSTAKHSVDLQEDTSKRKNVKLGLGYVRRPPFRSLIDD